MKRDEKNLMKWLFKSRLNISSVFSRKPLRQRLICFIPLWSIMLYGLWLETAYIHAAELYIRIIGYGVYGLSLILAIFSFASFGCIFSYGIEFSEKELCFNVLFGSKRLPYDSITAYDLENVFKNIPTTLKLITEKSFLVIPIKTDIDIDVLKLLLQKKLPGKYGLMDSNEGSENDA